MRLRHHPRVVRMGQDRPARSCAKPPPATPARANKSPLQTGAPPLADAARRPCHATSPHSDSKPPSPQPPSPQPQPRRLAHPVAFHAGRHGQPVLHQRFTFRPFAQELFRRHHVALSQISLPAFAIHHSSNRRKTLRARLKPKAIPQLCLPLWFSSEYFRVIPPHLG